MTRKDFFTQIAIQVIVGVIAGTILWVVQVILG